MRAIIVLALLAGASAESCVDGMCACRNEPGQLKPVSEGLESRLKIVAQEKKNSWKFKESAKKVEWKKIYYINLDNSQDRKNKLLQKLPGWAHGIPTERFSAFTRAQAREFNISHFTPKGIAPYMEQNWGDGGKWGTAAVFLSHASLLEKIYNEDPKGTGLYVILEDDAKITDPGWKGKVESLFKEHKVPDDWDILKIGFWGAKRCQDFVSDKVLEARAPAFSPDGKEAFYGGNVAYIVRPKSIPTILDQLRSSQLYDVDGATLSLHKERVTEEGHSWSWGAHTYVMNEPVVWGGLDADTIRLADASKKDVALLQMSRMFGIKSKAQSQIQANIHIEQEETSMPTPWIEWGF